ncbi:hypothetical protein BC834DRAFT_846856 [Gloeopeniophorella convolvens]|nr:hypothetical protein BC834DRAFT_846856 [Gloeopeniophorella convolvens]
MEYAPYEDDDEDLWLDDATPRVVCNRDNLRALVGRLVPEILCQILEIHATIEPPGSGWGDSRHKVNRLGWIKFTHVCCKWRQAALAWSAVWVNIRFYLKTEAIEAMISRRQHAPLRLDMHNAPLSLPFDDFLLEHLPRIEFLSTAVTQPGDSGLYSEWINRPAPQLKELRFTPFLQRYPKRAIAKCPPEHPFADQAPNLRSIFVDDYPNFFWRSGLLKTISTLIIGNFDDPDIHEDEDYERPSYDQLLSTLEGMPRLETLHLSFCLPYKMPEEAERTVALPSLKALLLQDSADYCLPIFKSLCVPNARLTLLLPQPTLIHLPHGVDSLVVPMLEKHFSAAHPSLQTLNALKVIWETSTYHSSSTALRAGTDPHLDDPDEKADLHFDSWADNESELPLHLSIPGYSPAHALLAASLWSELPRCSVRTLSLDLRQAEWDTAAWCGLAQSLPNLQELALSEQLAVSFLESCAPYQLGSAWRSLRAVRLGPLWECFEAPAGYRHFERVLADWLREWVADARTPPAVELWDTNTQHTCE